MLVSSTDGVGTKALVAQAAGRFTSIGVDLVAMCVDDLVCQGAEPLFFLDYIAVGRLDPDHIEQLVEGVAEGCRQAGCALIGGEMAEHPGAMEPGEFDLVGFAVGVAERDRLITGDHGGRRRRADRPARRRTCGPTGTRWPGASCSTGPASPSTARPTRAPATRSADELLSPVGHLRPGGGRAAAGRRRAGRSPTSPAGASPATSPGSCRRAPPPRSTAAAGRCPRIFGELQRLGQVDDAEMARVFNLGLGMIVVVPEGDAFKALDVARAAGHRAVEVGRVVAGDGAVRLV